MHELLVLLSSMIISFIGSLQLGPVNLLVITTVLKTSKKQALLVALGGIMPEFIYCGLAVFSGNYLLTFPLAITIFKIVVVCVLTLIAIMYFLKKHSVATIDTQHNKNNTTTSKNISKGFLLGIFNPQLLPFWVFIFLYFNTHPYLTLYSMLDKILFVLGAGIGAFLLLLSFILVATNYKSKLQLLVNNKYYYKLLALLFLAIATQQLISIIK